MYTLAVTGVLHANTARSVEAYMFMYKLIQKAVYEWFTVQHPMHGGCPCGDHAQQKLTQVKRKGWSVVEVVLSHSDVDGRCHWKVQH